MAPGGSGGRRGANRWTRPARASRCERTVANRCRSLHARCRPAPARRCRRGEGVIGVADGVGARALSRSASSSPALKVARVLERAQSRVLLGVAGHQFHRCRQLRPDSNVLSSSFMILRSEVGCAMPFGRCWFCPQTSKRFLS